MRLGGGLDSAARSGPFRGLLVTALAWNAITVAHGLDHLRQGMGRLSFEVSLLAGAGGAMAALTLFLVVREHPYAPLFAVWAGLNVAAGLVVSHFLPRWSEFSDPYQDAGVDAIAWAIAVADATAALVAAYAGYRVLRRRSAARRLEAVRPRP